MSKNAKKTESAFIAETLPTEFESVLGAMILCGWSYDLLHEGKRITVTGTPSKAARDAFPKWQRVSVRLDYIGGEWSYDGLMTGLVRTSESSAGLMFDLKPLDKLVDYIGRRIDPETLVDIEPEPAAADEETVDTETVTEEVVEEEVIDETKALA